MLFFSALSASDQQASSDSHTAEPVAREGNVADKSESPENQPSSEPSVDEMCEDFDDASVSSSDSENSTLHGADSEEEDGDDVNEDEESFAR